MIALWFDRLAVRLEIRARAIGGVAANVLVGVADDLRQVTRDIRWVATATTTEEPQAEPSTPTQAPPRQAPVNKHATMWTLRERLGDIVEEVRLPPGAFEGQPIWRLEEFLDAVSMARSAIDAVETVVRHRIAEISSPKVELVGGDPE